MKKLTKGEMVSHALEACFAIDRIEQWFNEEADESVDSLQHHIDRVAGHLDAILGRTTEHAKTFDFPGGPADRKHPPADRKRRKRRRKS